MPADFACSFHPSAWIRWIDPVYYAVSSLISDRLSGKTLECVPNNLVPYGEGYTQGQNQGVCYRFL